MRQSKGKPWVVVVVSLALLSAMGVWLARFTVPR